MNIRAATVFPFIHDIRLSLIRKQEWQYVGFFQTAM